MQDPRLSRLAGVLVNYSIDAKPDQLVRITGSPLATPLVMEIYRKVIEAGAHPMIHLTPEDAQELLLKYGNDSQLAYVNPVAKFEVERIDCSISIWAEENTRALTNVDPERMRRNDAARRPLLDTFLKRAATKELKWVGTQYPTQACAQDAEMSLGEFEEFVFNA